MNLLPQVLKQPRLSDRASRSDPMKITKITQQQKRLDRYSIYVDDTYAFSLSEGALLDSKITSGQPITKEQVDTFKQLSSEDKLYQRALRYVAMRPRSVWELETYLKRKDSPAPLIEQITNKLTSFGYLDDDTFAETFVRDRRLLRSASVRKITLDLRKKHVPSEVIERALGKDETDEASMLKELIAKKRKQQKYRDDELKLMQYLARQGFSYGDIKTALQADVTE
jgi:regulatory protein